MKNLTDIAFALERSGSPAKNSILQSTVPLNRGQARHIEHSDLTSFVRYEKDGTVAEMHTPQETLMRIHEVLHARHSRANAYTNIRPVVADIVEDCRLHLNHWPWAVNQTPRSIADDVRISVLDELKLLGILSKEKKKGGAFVDFAIRLRAMAVCSGLNYTIDLNLNNKGNVIYSWPEVEIKVEDQYMSKFFDNIMKLIREGNHFRAAKIIQAAFFIDESREEKKEKEKKDKSFLCPGEDGVEGDCEEDGEEEADGDDWKSQDEEEYRKLSGASSRMSIIDLDRTEMMTHATLGFRRATSGNRVYRPALRKPILDQKLFIKNTPLEPGGSILFDASSSMKITQEVLNDCCQRAPTAVVAYYSGSDGTGMGNLWIYAKDGMRATAVSAYPGGNAVDGPALDWFMQQEKPRLFVTDRHFCGANDSEMQRARLNKLEDEEELTVYTSYAEFMRTFPKII